MNFAVDKSLAGRKNIGTASSGAREKKSVNRIDVRACDELYNMIADDSTRLGISMGEVLTRTYAEVKGEPDLGILQKEKPGPKPRLRPEPSGHKNGKRRVPA